MAVEVALVLAGLAILLVAGDLLVRGAAGLAEAIHVPPLIIGLTIVAFGTSAPELMVTIDAVATGHSGIALGNIIGSNIANVLLVLGLPAIIYPIVCDAPGVDRNTTIMIIATALFAGFAYFGGALTPTRGFIMLGLLIAFLLYLAAMITARRIKGLTAEDIADVDGVPHDWMKISIFVIIGLIGLPLGADILVDNASVIARTMMVREELIGLTIVAFGTSLPELATVTAAAFRKNSAVALGGVVGSNMFNLLAVGGAAGITAGAVGDPTAASFSNAALWLDIPAMAIATLIAAAFIYPGARISRPAGFAFVAAYVGYIYLLYLVETGKVSYF